MLHEKNKKFVSFGAQTLTFSIIVRKYCHAGSFTLREDADMRESLLFWLVESNCSYYCLKSEVLELMWLNESLR